MNDIDLRKITAAPSLISTDFNLPFEALIDWTPDIIRITLNRIKEIESIVLDLHNNLNVSSNIY